MSRYLRFVPLVVLLLFVAVVAWRLVMPEDSKIRSRMTGQPVPAFA
jgi:cytochrome c biogenesis protein CcmG/thiol:disulfide interchange protein DsbE